MPWMIQPRLHWAPGRVNRSRLRRPNGTRRDDVIVERPPVVRDPRRPIQLFFHHHVGGPDIIMDLIEPPVVGHRPIAAQHPLRFHA